MHKHYSNSTVIQSLHITFIINFDVQVYISQWQHKAAVAHCILLWLLMLEQTHLDRNKTALCKQLQLHSHPVTHNNYIIIMIIWTFPPTYIYNVSPSIFVSVPTLYYREHAWHSMHIVEIDQVQDIIQNAYHRKMSTTASVANLLHKILLALQFSTHRQL